MRRRSEEEMDDLRIEYAEEMFQFRHPERYARGQANQTYTCHFCKESGFQRDEGTKFHAGFACESCATECALCGDFMQNQPETTHEGKRVHCECLLDELGLYPSTDPKERSAA